VAFAISDSHPGATALPRRILHPVSEKTAPGVQLSEYVAASPARSGSRPHCALTDPTVWDRLPSSTQTAGAIAGSAPLPPRPPRRLERAQSGAVIAIPQAVGTHRGRAARFRRSFWSFCMRAGAGARSDIGALGTSFVQGRLGVHCVSTKVGYSERCV
jgi:hypothetical protein